MKEFYDEVRLKKEEKARRKLEKKEAEERELAEREKLEARRMKAEMKAKKKVEDAKRADDMEKERGAEMKKDLDMHMAVRMSEMEESFFERFEHTLAPLCQVLRHKGKQKVSYKSASESASASSDGESDTSVTKELNDHTRRLCISDKRKRGLEPVFEDSPPMEQPPKRTPKCGALKPVKLIARITRSKAKFRTPAKSGVGNEAVSGKNRSSKKGGLLQHSWQVTMENGHGSKAKAKVRIVEDDEDEGARHRGGEKKGAGTRSVREVKRGRDENERDVDDDESPLITLLSKKKALVAAGTPSTARSEVEGVSAAARSTLPLRIPKAASAFCGVGAKKMPQSSSAQVRKNAGKMEEDEDENSAPSVRARGQERRLALRRESRREQKMNERKRDNSAQWTPPVIRRKARGHGILKKRASGRPNDGAQRKCSQHPSSASNPSLLALMSVSPQIGSGRMADRRRKPGSGAQGVRPGRPSAGAVSAARSLGSSAAVDRASAGEGVKVGGGVGSVGSGLVVCAKGNYTAAGRGKSNENASLSTARADVRKAVGGESGENAEIAAADRGRAGESAAGAEPARVSVPCASPKSKANEFAMVAFSDYLQRTNAVCAQAQEYVANALGHGWEKKEARPMASHGSIGAVGGTRAGREEKDENRGAVGHMKGGGPERRQRDRSAAVAEEGGELRGRRDGDHKEAEVSRSVENRAKRDGDGYRAAAAEEESATVLKVEWNEARGKRLKQQAREPRAEYVKVEEDDDDDEEEDEDDDDDEEEEEEGEEVEGGGGEVDDCRKDRNADPSGSGRKRRVVSGIPFGPICPLPVHGHGLKALESVTNFDLTRRLKGFLKRKVKAEEKAAREMELAKAAAQHRSESLTATNPPPPPSRASHKVTRDSSSPPARVDSPLSVSGCTVGGRLSEANSAQPMETDGEAMPSPYEQLRENVFVHRIQRRLLPDEIPLCDCKYNPDDPDSACGEDRCINAMLNTECIPQYCKCADKCRNQRFQRCEYAKTRLVKTAHTGWGLVADEDIKAGSFVIEYCGEVVSEKQTKRRVEAYYAAGERNAYMLRLTSQEVIDASKKGSLARFINHSCNPNCETRKWSVLGELRVGIFALKDIGKGTELTYDYKLEWYGRDKVLCHCGAPNCARYLGAKSKAFLLRQAEAAGVATEENSDSIDEDMPLRGSRQSPKGRTANQPKQKGVSVAKAAATATKMNDSWSCTPTTLGPSECAAAAAAAAASLPMKHVLERETDASAVVLIPGDNLVLSEHDDHDHHHQQQQGFKPQVVDEAMDEHGWELVGSKREMMGAPPDEGGTQTTAGKRREGGCASEDGGSERKRKKKMVMKEGSWVGRIRLMDSDLLARLLRTESAIAEIVTTREAAVSMAKELDNLAEEMKPIAAEVNEGKRKEIPSWMAERWLSASAKQMQTMFAHHYTLVWHALGLTTESDGGGGGGGGEAVVASRSKPVVGW
ncbi:hypothetical protein CBR_g12731 [Chara braunii]|uniref:Histone-lysine N-methyltransferase n=1 Tax=Chara braunii TaxID=69332 RepID=A0A388KSM7_CHABU|nr:hypothetical protein CBR_g12731 [Chara braunii]|eukprot:GBG73012.1 hypothetical protein CBR_g12731 [Chara braunii]